MRTLELWAPDSDPEKTQPLHKGARIIGLKDGKVALLYYRQLDHYVLPGGGIEENETPLDAVHRETLEETGYPLKDVSEVLLLKEYFADSAWEHTFFTGQLIAPPQPVHWTDEEAAYGIELQFHDPLTALDILSAHQGQHPYSEAIMNREFLGLVEALNHPNMTKLTPKGDFHGDD